MSRQRTQAEQEYYEWINQSIRVIKPKKKRRKAPSWL